MKTVSIKNLSKRFGGIHALKSIDLQIEKNCVTGLVGPNGSGKTTLLNCISGTIRPDHGSVLYEGIQTSTSPVVAYYAGMVRTFQSARLFPQLTVMENLLLVHDVRTVHGSLSVSGSESEQEKNIKEILSKLSIESKADHLASDLSYGQKKLVELARVMLSGKEVILLDEPFAGLFPKVIQFLIGVIKELKESGKTIVLVEHNPRIIRQLCDRVVVLDAGEVIADGMADFVFEQKHVREAYLGE